MRLYAYPCVFGHVCITTTDGILCGVEIGKTSGEAIMLASRRFGKICADPFFHEESLSDVVDMVLRAVNEGFVDPNLKMYLMTGTWMQVKVWEELRKTQVGETLSYKEL